MTAYQITSMHGGRGAARARRRVVRAVGKPIAGKTGTTNDEKDAWFVGFSPDLVVGVFIGFDQPRPMGRGMTGGHVAAPIFTEFMKVALADQPPKEFQVPPGIELIPIDRRTGLRAQRRRPRHDPGGLQAGHGAAVDLFHHRISGHDGTAGHDLRGGGPRAVNRHRRPLLTLLNRYIWDAGADGTRALPIRETGTCAPRRRHSSMKSAAPSR